MTDEAMKEMKEIKENFPQLIHVMHEFIKTYQLEKEKTGKHERVALSIGVIGDTGEEFPDKAFYGLSFYTLRGKDKVVRYILNPWGMICDGANFPKVYVGSTEFVQKVSK